MQSSPGAFGPFVCEKCPRGALPGFAPSDPKIFKNKGALKVHMTRKHKKCICKTKCEPAEYYGVYVECR